MQRIVPLASMTLRGRWLRHFGGLQTFSIKNKEWLSLLEEDTRQSLMIEGEFVNRRELKDILERGQGGTARTAHKVLGYFDAASASYEFAFQQYQEKEFQLSKALIRQMHSMMFRNDPHFPYPPGAWRRGDITILGASHKPPTAERVESAIEILVRIANMNNIPPTQLAALVHALFEHIHPFPDGNGRVGRILMNFILIAHGFPNIALKGLESERRKYIAALEEADVVIGPALANRKTWSVALRKPLLRLEDLLAHNLAIAMDAVICGRLEQAGTPLLSLEEVATKTGRELSSFRSACSQKKYISTKRGRQLFTHPRLLGTPQN